MDDQSLLLSSWVGDHGDNDDGVELFLLQQLMMIFAKHTSEKS